MSDFVTFLIEIFTVDIGFHFQNKVTPIMKRDNLKKYSNKDQRNIFGTSK